MHHALVALPPCRSFQAPLANIGRFGYFHKAKSLSDQMSEFRQRPFGPIPQSAELHFSPPQKLTYDQFDRFVELVGSHRPTGTALPPDLALISAAVCGNMLPRFCQYITLRLECFSEYYFGYTLCVSLCAYSCCCLRRFVSKTVCMFGGRSLRSYVRLSNCNIYALNSEGSSELTYKSFACSIQRSRQSFNCLCY